jgi:hypothetical protein
MPQEGRPYIAILHLNKAAAGKRGTQGSRLVAAKNVSECKPQQSNAFGVLLHDLQTLCNSHPKLGDNVLLEKIFRGLGAQHAVYSRKLRGCEVHLWD